MSPDPQTDLDALLREEPYVRALARVLCSGHEDEIVQQTWLQACEHRGKPVKKPRAWLGTIVRNVTKNLLRRERRRQRREQAAARSSVAPSSVELMQREERRRKLVELIDTLPQDQREVMLLRYFEGMPPRDIAAQLGLPASTVWNLHRRALERMRTALDKAADQRGQTRSGWLLPLLGTPWAAPIAVDPTPVASSATALPAGMIAGSIAITMKTKLVATVAVLAAIALAVYWPDTEVPVPPTDQNAQANQANLQTGGASTDATTGTQRNGPQTERRIAAPTADQATTGAIEVTVLFGGKHPGPAPFTTITYRQRNDDRRLAPRCQTDEAGFVRIEDLTPGMWYLNGDRHERTQRVEVAAGETHRVEITYPEGLHLNGIVLDDNERPVAGALIVTAMPMLVGRDPEVLAISNNEGRFEIHSAFRPCLLGARAAGFLASPMQMAYADMGDAVELKIQLARGGGTVEGTIVDQKGNAIADALICIGEGQVQGLGTGTLDNTPPLPALVRSDADGKFRALSVAAGDAPVWARAHDMAPWRGTCSVANFGTSTLRITMQPGGVVRGVVRASDGEPVAKAEVLHGDWQQMENTRTYSNADGEFELRGLPLGAVVVRAEHDDQGRVQETLTLAPGQPLEHDFVLSLGLQLQGRVLDQHGKPVAKVSVEATAERTPTQKHWMRYTRTDDAGNYLIPNCPISRPLAVEFSNKLIARHVVKDFDPQKGRLDMVVQRIGSNAHIAGCVVDPTGKPLAGVRVSPRNEARSQHLSPFTTKADGKFSFGPLPEGIWKVALSHKDHPSRTLTSHRLGGDERWELDNVALQLGGSAVIRPQSVPGEDLNFMIADTQSTARWSLRQAGEPVTPILRPGNYLLQAWGRSAAAQVVRFTIIGGQQTEILLHTQVGQKQQLIFEYDRENETTYGATLAVYAGEDKIVDRWLATKPGEDWGYDLWLLPGTYRVTLSGKLSAATTLTIGATAPPTRTLQLRKK